jgi:hypothetical protein
MSFSGIKTNNPEARSRKKDLVNANGFNCGSVSQNLVGQVAQHVVCGHNIAIDHIDYG